jgi:hypothetical protein
MKNKIKHTSVFILWLAYMVFFFHAAIPHQQHLNTGYEQGFQTSTTDDNSNNAPVNCQLFRISSFNKPENNTAGNSIEITHQSPAMNPESYPCVVDKTGAIAPLSNAVEGFAKVFFRESIPVRGSPFTS